MCRFCDLVRDGTICQTEEECERVRHVFDTHWKRLVPDGCEIGPESNQIRIPVHERLSFKAYYLHLAYYVRHPEKKPFSADTLSIVRTCSTEGCVKAEHLLVVTRHLAADSRPTMSDYLYGEWLLEQSTIPLPLTYEERYDCPARVQTSPHRIWRCPHACKRSVLNWCGLRFYAHRLAYLVHHRLRPADLPETVLITHLCQGGGTSENVCCEPSHLKSSKGKFIPNELSTVPMTE